VAVDLLHFVDDREAVAALEVVVEVDVARKDVGDLAGDRVGQADRIGRSVERRADPPARSSSRTVACGAALAATKPCALRSTARTSPFCIR
jgi:hypothetical protein